MLFKHLKTRFNLFGFLSLLTIGFSHSLPASSEPQVLSVPGGQVSEIKKLIPDADILGVNQSAQTVQIRVSPEQAILILDQFKQSILQKTHSLISESVAGYKTPEQVVQILENLSAQYSEIVTMREFGRSTENRPLYLIELSTRSENKSSKPVILFNGMHHARELMTTEVILDIASYLTSHYASDSEVQQWLDQYRIVLVPQVNPDGNQKVHDSDRWWRKNTWKKNGRVWGVDLNRNYPSLWNACNGSSGSVFAQDYRGPEPGSEPETQAMMALVTDIQPVFNISYHSYSELIIYPFGCESQENRSSALYKNIATAMADQVIDDQGRTGTYSIGTAPELLYEADGTDLDYQWAEHNVMAFTLEVNSSSQGFQPDYQRWRDKTVQAQRGGWMELIRQMQSGGVQARIQNPEVTGYRIKFKTAQAYKSWDPERHKAQKLRNGTFLYQILPDGEYQLILYGKTGKLSSHPFKVSAAITDLGEIEI